MKPRNKKFMNKYDDQFFRNSAIHFSLFVIMSNCSTSYFSKFAKYAEQLKEMRLREEKK